MWADIFFPFKNIDEYSSRWLSKKKKKNIDDCPFSLPHIIAIPIPCLQEMDEEGHLIHNCVHI
jgi:hypothetical protein